MPLNKERVFVTPKELLKTKEIPSIAVFGETLPEAWENAVLATWEYGADVPTQYDQLIDPDSKDSSLMLTVTSPLKEPRIHRCLPADLVDLGVYVEEVVNGVHDHLVKVASSSAHWSYSYHDRLTNWPGLDSGKVEIPFISKAENHDRKVVDECFLSTEGETISETFAMSELQKVMAKMISDLSGVEVKVGRYVDISDSFHIYGSDIRKNDIVPLFTGVEKRTFAERTYRSDDQIVLDAFEIAKQRLIKERVLK